MSSEIEQAQKREPSILPWFPEPQYTEIDTDTHMSQPRDHLGDMSAAIFAYPVMAMMVNAMLLWLPSQKQDGRLFLFVFAVGWGTMSVLFSYAAGVRWCYGIEVFVFSRVGLNASRPKRLVLCLGVGAAFVGLGLAACWINPIEQLGLAAQGDWVSAVIGGAFLFIVPAVLVCVYGLIKPMARLLARPTFRLKEKSLADASDLKCCLTVTHWSDLHITASDEHVRVERGGGGNVSLKEVVRKYGEELAMTDLLLITGDVTDSGRGEEWQRVFEILGGLSTSVREKMVLVPGNHDVNITNSVDHWEAEGAGMPKRNVRLVRVMAALELVQGQRAWVWPSGMGAVTLSELLVMVEPFLRAYIEKPAQAVYRKKWIVASDGSTYAVPGEDVTPPDVKALINFPAAVWREIWPMAIEVPGKKTVVVVINSNSDTNNVVENAVGVIGQDCLSKLGLVRLKFPGYRVIVALHHHLVLPDFDTPVMKKLKAHFMQLVDAPDFVSELLETSTVVFHGHKHVHYVGTLNDTLDIVSAPSTTLGDGIHRKPPFYLIYELVERGETGIALASKRIRWVGTQA
ncbi:metallophosphoesterase family protein [Archangium lansingense]|uniref:metallophosphoesterase family protein n=1 Tax=Archangium lansingense TaxID=2995310 RepID=UPI003B76079E